LDVDRACKYARGVFAQYIEGLADAGYPRDGFRNKRILEIGPGANLGVQVCLVASGATQADALDRFWNLRTGVKERELYTRLQRQIANDGAAGLSDLEPAFPGESDRIRYFCGLSLEAAGDNDDLRGYDMVVAHLALEHVANLDRGLLSVSRMLRPGGICIFVCNLVSLGGVYRHRQEPLRLLCYSDALWWRMFSNRGGSNRIRASGYRRLLDKHGFDVLSFKTLRQARMDDVRHVRPMLDRQFRDLADDDLQMLMFRLVARLRHHEISRAQS
jgi:SAM-dependent methyltransferase